MKPLNNIIYLELSDFPEVAHQYLWTAMKRSREGEGTSYLNIPDPTDARKRLIAYDSIPKSFLETHKIPSKEELLKKHRFKSITELVKIDTKDVDFYLNIPKANPHASEYADIASWHKWCAMEAVAFAKAHNMDTVDELYEICIELMNCRNWRKWKIKNLRKFKDSIKPFKDALKDKISTDEALQSLISDKDGLQNAAKLLIESEAQNLLIQVHGDTSKPSFTQTYMLYMHKALENVNNGTWSKKTLITETTAENFLKRPEVIQQWYLTRHGEQAWRRKFDYINKRIPASFANAKWVIDGTQFPLYYQENNNAYARLNVFVVLDEHSWCVVGFMISESENSDQVISSLHMACKLNSVVPHQIQFDNSKAIQSVKTQMVINSIASYGTATQVGNARAKVIEPFFKQLFTRILRFEYGYAFSPVMGKGLDSAQNRDALQYQIKNNLLPQGREEARHKVTEILNNWNAHTFKGESPLQKYRNSLKETQEHQRPFTHMLEVDAFWKMPGEVSQIDIIRNGKKSKESYFKPTEYTYTNWGLRLEVNKEKFDFALPEATWLSNSIGSVFNLKYDPCGKMDMVYLYKDGKPVANEAGEFVKLQNKEAFHSAIADHTPGEMGRIMESNTVRKEHKSIVTARQKNTVSLTKQDGNYTPVTLGNMYPKEIMNSAKTLMLENEWQGKLSGNEPEPDTEVVTVETVRNDRYSL